MKDGLYLNQVFVDSSFWVARFNNKDANHEAAQAILRRLLSGEFGLPEFVTTDYMLHETMNVLVRRGPNTTTPLNKIYAVQVHDQILRENLVLEVDRRLWTKAVSKYFRHGDKDYSVQDCVSFQVMDDLGIAHSLAFDEHFRQAARNVLGLHLLS